MARLAGLAVFDPAGDKIGRIRDVVVGLRGPLPPRVHGYVVEVQPRRRVFLPITRVISVEAGAVIFTGRLNLRRFQQRESETLAIGELLDLKITVDDEPGTVLDLAMEQPSPPDWLITKVAVRRGTRRRGETTVVDWGQVTGFEVAQKDQGALSLLAAFDAMRPADLAGVLQELPGKRMAEVAAALNDDRLADVLEELPERDQVAVLGQPRRGARRRRAGAHGPRRRRRPAPGAPARPGRGAAGPDDPRRGRSGTPPPRLRRGHRRRHDDHRARHPAAQRHASPRRWPACATASSRPRSPPRSSWPARPPRPPPAATSASRTSSGCSASPASP